MKAGLHYTAFEEKSILRKSYNPEKRSHPNYSVDETSTKKNNTFKSYCKHFKKTNNNYIKPKSAKIKRVSLVLNSCIFTQTPEPTPLFFICTNLNGDLSSERTNFKKSANITRLNTPKKRTIQPNNCWAFVSQDKQIEKSAPHTPIKLSARFRNIEFAKPKIAKRMEDSPVLLKNEQSLLDNGNTFKLIISHPRLHSSIEGKRKNHIIIKKPQSAIGSPFHRQSVQQSSNNKKMYFTPFKKIRKTSLLSIVELSSTQQKEISLKPEEATRLTQIKMKRAINIYRKNVESNPMTIIRLQAKKRKANIS